MRSLIYITLSAALLAFGRAQDIQKPASFIVHGDNATANRYPYYVSLRYQTRSLKNKTTTYSPYCGGTLISDRLVLSAAHCAMDPEFSQDYSSATANDFKKLGFNFSAFPNTYIIDSSLKLSAFVSATGQTVSGSGNPIVAWFVHPWYDDTNLYYDVAVALLANPVTNVSTVKLFNGPGDIYTQIDNTTNITAIGLGDAYSDDYADIESALNSSFVDLNNSTTSLLEESVIGTLVPRVLCGKAITQSSQQNVSSNSGNTQLGTLATVISAGQLCVGPADNAAIDAQMRQQAQSIVNSAHNLSPSVENDLDYDDVDPTNVQEVYTVLPGYNDTCQGDSGGPILIKGATSSDDIQLGTTSYGEGCGSGIAGVYNSVQAFLNATTFDDFLMRVIMAVPNQNGGSSMSNLVTTIPGIQSAG